MIHDAIETAVQKKREAFKAAAKAHVEAAFKTIVAKYTNRSIYRAESDLNLGAAYRAVKPFLRRLNVPGDVLESTCELDQPAVDAFAEKFAQTTGEDLAKRLAEKAAGIHVVNADAVGDYVFLINGTKDNRPVLITQQVTLAVSKRGQLVAHSTCRMYVDQMWVSPEEFAALTCGCG